MKTRDNCCSNKPNKLLGIQVCKKIELSLSSICVLCPMYFHYLILETDDRTSDYLVWRDIWKGYIVWIFGKEQIQRTIYKPQHRRK